MISEKEIKIYIQINLIVTREVMEGFNHIVDSATHSLKQAQCSQSI